MRLPGSPGPRSFLADEGGQFVVILAVVMVVLAGLVGLVVDVAWYQVNVLRVQRAADAAALAGVVYLPSDPAGAYQRAREEAAKNGYANGVGGVVVTPQQDAGNNRVLLVTVHSRVPSVFSRLFGIDSFEAERVAKAQYVLPVPMGSPQDYLGVYQLCDSSATCGAVGRAPDADGVPKLSSQGLWLGVITKGGQRSNGDAYSPYWDGAVPSGNYDPAGYSYIVEMPNGTTNGSVYLFDPTFCAVGHAASGSYLGTGDHWIGTGGLPVTTEFRLYDTRGTPYTTIDDVLLVETGTLFKSKNQVDKGPRFTGNGRYSDGGYDGASSPDCKDDPYHNKWYLLRDRLGAGIYRLQVWTSNDDNNNTNAENMFGIQAISNVAGARVYGQDRMAAYNNLDGASAIFYLAQVDRVHAGKTLQIRLFDPGDVGGNAFLRIKKPTATGYVDATFDFVADGGRGPARGNGVTELQTARGGSTLYNNAWVTISIALPSNYGSDGITPPGETAPGWWKIEYEITRSGNDTTTWEVGVRGNPVHLVVP